MEKILVFANDEKKLLELCAGAKAMADKVILVSSGENNGLADELYKYDAALSVSLMLKAISELAEKEKPELILCEKSADGRLVAGYTAAAMGLSPMAEASDIEIEGDRVITSRLVYGGSAVMKESSALPAVIVPGSGIFAFGNEKAPCTLHTLEPETTEGMELIDTEPLEAKSVNLGAAKKIVSVGRGIGAEENIPAAKELADALGAELGCTRPVAEEEHWLDKERYIGVSGCMVKPSLYVALGISGQIQHMVGANTAGVIFAVNKDENAPIIKQADYTLIADLNKVLPEITEKLSD